MIVVVGAGVSGLTCALRLLEDGHDVEVWARDRSPDTTSDVAAAVWYPLRGERDERTDRWLPVSYERFLSLAGDPKSGVVPRGGVELFREPAEDAWWREILPGFRHARPDELPAGFADGFVAERIPVVEMSTYLPYLARRIATRGGRMRACVLATLGEALAVADMVVNCAGLGARELCDDDDVVPVRGQVARVAQFGLERYILDEWNPDGITYMYPRATDVVLGGTREEGVWSREPDPATERAIIERCAALDPRVRDAPVVSRAVGLRPARPRVRLEAEERAGALLVHDYGHGGSGVTLSWGCAEDVARLAREHLSAGRRRRD